MAYLSGLLRGRKSFNRLLQTHYPGFIFGLQLPRNEIPIFTYHYVSAHDFAEDLSFLKENGYRTLSTDEYVQLSKLGTANERCVLLTFDDAERNFYEVAFPLLCEFGAKATLFVPTIWVGKAAKAISADKIESGNKTDHERLFMTWSELRECQSSGNVDVQSHAHRHTIIYTSNRLIGFATPALLSKYHIFDWPMRADNGYERLGRPLLGSPIYEGIPLLSAKFRVIEDPETSKACQKLVEDNGGPSFFNQSDWFTRLHRMYDEISGKNKKFRKMNDNEFESLVMSEFALSQELFEKQMGAAAKYFAYPWMLGSELSLRFAKEIGIKAVFGVGLDYKKISKLKASLPAFGRLKGDWLQFMPGQGRVRLWNVLPQKIKGFFQNQHLAH